jgi:uncharacterized protein YbbK (DUF523 family)
MERVTTARAPYASDEPIKIGVSSCLLGEQVRFDGGHKRSDFIVDTLGSFVEFVPVCPEMEIGLGTPRETLRLVHDGNASHKARLVTNKSGIDLTEKMDAYAERLGSAGAGNGYALREVRT